MCKNVTCVDVILQQSIITSHRFVSLKMCVVMFSSTHSHTHAHRMLHTTSPYLIGIVFGKKYDFYVARFANKRLRLFCFAAKHTRISTIRYIRFSIAIHNLQ